jgi:hypothetical protein
MWKIYYSSGTYSGDDPGFAPARDVQVIVQSDKNNGWFIQTGSDYYIWRDERWWGVDYPGLFDYLIEPGWKRVLFGRTIDGEEYNRIMSRAMRDPDFPEKTGWRSGERR